ncbi:MAG: hypothetical protein ABI977_19345 [Acidobacteriota bacterium]
MIAGKTNAEGRIENAREEGKYQMSTPTLDQVFHDAQQLPLEDQRALVALIKPPKSIERLAAEQGVKPFDPEKARQQAAGIWPEEESLDDFTAWLRESRKEGAAESKLD